MDCNTCVIGVTLILAGFYMSLLKQDKDIFVDFYNLLNVSQKERYIQIIKERMRAYVMGMTIGLLSAIMFHYRMPTQTYPLCTFLTIVYVVKLLVYYFYPKSPLMLWLH